MVDPLSCPKCEYVRRPKDDAPFSQCPKCGVIFSKYAKLKLQENEPPPNDTLISQHRPQRKPVNFPRWPVLAVVGAAFFILVFIIATAIKDSQPTSGSSSVSLVWLFLLFFIVAASGHRSKARALKLKFQKLGVLTGKSKSEILAAVGSPNSFSVVGQNQTLLQWQAPGYHIAIIFTEDICDGVSHEHVS